MKINKKKKLIIDKSLELGFSIIRFSRPKIENHIKSNYKIFLSKNYHCQMKWMERHFKIKNNPEKLWKEVKSIIILGSNYAPEKNPLVDNSKKKNANISVYARNKDYHTVIKKKLRIFKSWLNDTLKIDAKLFVDTAPIYEKPLAQASGIGWQGKHTNIVSKKYGSWLFLSEIFLPIEIEKDSKEIDNCGSCSKCINICPTNAIIDDYKIDARKCISYLTIEHKGPFPMSLRKEIGNKVYGCDDCLAICPWNKFSNKTDQIDFIPRKNLLNPKLSYFLKFDKKMFEKEFCESPIKRIGWVSFIRNIIIASGNSKARELIKDLKPLLLNSNPIVRGSAVWAYGQLANKNEKNEIKKKFMNNEKNSYVLYEWSFFS